MHPYVSKSIQQKSTIWSSLTLLSGSLLLTQQVGSWDQIKPPFQIWCMFFSLITNAVNQNPVYPPVCSIPGYLDSSNFCGNQVFPSWLNIVFVCGARHLCVNNEAFQLCNLSQAPLNCEWCGYRSVAMLVHSGKLFNDDPSPFYAAHTHTHAKGPSCTLVTFTVIILPLTLFCARHMNAHRLPKLNSGVSLTMACTLYGLSATDMRPKQMNEGGGWNIAPCLLLLACQQLKDPNTAFDALCHSDWVELDVRKSLFFFLHVVTD